MKAKHVVFLCFQQLQKQEINPNMGHGRFLSMTQSSWIEIVRDPYSGLFLVFEAVENTKIPRV